jgi:uncharacterized protein (DUF488 family)
MKQIFTIGHSNHSFGHFIELLASQSVSSIADVRSHPYSQYCPQFNKGDIEQFLKNAGIEYIFLGKELGARTSDENCYIEGQAKYQLISESLVFQSGLEYVVQKTEKSRLALMCSEAEPLNCHRMILICRQLKKRNPDIKIIHILGDGSAESQEESEQRLIRLHKLQPELFGELTTMSGIIEKAYELQANKIEFKKDLVEI